MIPQELLHLTDQETVRIVRSTADELEVEGTWMPGGSPPPAHLHPSQDEEFEVRSGRLTAVVDCEERKLGPGDTLRIARTTPQKMFNADNETATALWRTRPAGRTADWDFAWWRWQTAEPVSDWAAGARTRRLVAGRGS